MTHKTKGIVLRNIKYGETSLVVTIFTELFGLQTYLVNGVRSTKKSSAKANLFQPAAILNLVVYHNEQKAMQRIKEFEWDVLYQHVLSDVIKNSIALYMVELLHKCLKQPEKHIDLFYFFEDILLQLDHSKSLVTANMPLFFSLQLPHFFGFKMNDDFDETHLIFDLQEGGFTNEPPLHNNYIDGEMALLLSQLLKVMQPKELIEFKMHHESRRKLLAACHLYYALHMPDFGNLKTMAVLQNVL